MKRSPRSRSQRPASSTRSMRCRPDSGRSTRIGASRRWLASRSLANVALCANTLLELRPSRKPVFGAGRCWRSATDRRPRSRSPLTSLSRRVEPDRTSSPIEGSMTTRATVSVGGAGALGGGAPPSDAAGFAGLSGVAHRPDSSRGFLSALGSNECTQRIRHMQQLYGLLKRGVMTRRLRLRRVGSVTGHG